MGPRQFAAFIAVLAVIGLLAFGLIKKSSGGVSIGEATPTKTLPALGGGGDGSLADYQGRWALVNVWASWCGPCREESPALQRFYSGHRANLVVLGIDTRDLTDDGRDFVREFGLEYPQLRDGDGGYAHDLGTTGVPESFLVAPSGKLVAHYPGPFRDDAAIAAFAAPAIGGRQ
jgi:cytochrome c biogenesis protein CcmG, thiol:disulfide interchange protein DsbE